VKKFLAPLICGFAIGIIQNVPIIGNFTCCILLPAAAFYSLLLDQKATKNFGRIPYSKGLMFGFLTGVSAAVIGSGIDIILTLIFKSNNFSMMANDFVKTMDEFPLDSQTKKQVFDLILKAKDDIIQYGFSFFYTFSYTIDQLFINSVFGCIGGLVGTKILNSNRNKNLNNQN
jgi:hypothetical protein